jgi:hypothetical protein
VLITNTPLRTTNENQKKQQLNIRHLENENEINIPNCSEKNTFLPKFSPFHGRKLQVGLTIQNPALLQLRQFRHKKGFPPLLLDNLL